MPKNKRLPDELLAKLHGKGTMSEILDIERARLLKQSEQDMRRQLGQLESQSLASQPPDSGTTPATSLPPLVPPDPSASPKVEREPTLPRPTSAMMESTASEHYRGTAMPFNAGAPSTKTAEIDTYQPPLMYVQHQRSTPSWPATQARGVEGLSILSRVVGDDLSELGAIFRHSAQTASAPPRFLPEAAQDYYTEMVEPVLPFTAQRNLLGAIRRLTLGWGALSCQITLELLANVSGIRNFKTLRKWLADLTRRNLIRYTPVHGDLRGSVVTLTPPSEVRAEIERLWHKGMPDTNRPLSRNEAS